MIISPKKLKDYKVEDHDFDYVIPLDIPFENRQSIVREFKEEVPIRSFAVGHHEVNGGMPPIAHIRRETDTGFQYMAVYLNPETCWEELKLLGG